MSFTPGPWGPDWNSPNNIIAENGTGRHICKVGGHGGHEDSANAHLIAAAPDLCEVVRGVAGIRDGCCGLAKDPLAACIHDDARTVLAKAKSES